ncbi:MAG: hypothetical protein PHC31_12090 [Clostridia bacterium]|nr:hypothetical protein [Clostridia bacterium]
MLNELEKQNVEVNNSIKLTQYREYLDKQIILLTDRYQLPIIAGVGKQVQYAIDIRIKLITLFDKHKLEIEDEVVRDIFAKIFSHTESRWWIDHKSMTYETMLKSVKSSMSCNENNLIIHNKIVINTESDDYIFINYSNDEQISLILERYKFSFYDGVWKYNLSINDAQRVGVIESLSLSLLQKGYIIQIVAKDPPKIIHDGYVCIINNKLCGIARTEPIYRAFSNIGMRRVWIDDKDIPSLRDIFEKYDVEYGEDVIEYMGKHT